MHWHAAERTVGGGGCRFLLVQTDRRVVRKDLVVANKVSTVMRSVLTRE